MTRIADLRRSAILAAALMLAAAPALQAQTEPAAAQSTETQGAETRAAETGALAEGAEIGPIEGAVALGGAVLAAPVHIGNQTGILRAAGKAVTLPFRALIMVVTGKDPKTDPR